MLEHRTRPNTSQNIKKLGETQKHYPSISKKK